MTRPLRGAALAAAQNTRRVTPPNAPRPALSDQVQAGGALPDLRELLHQPDVTVQADEFRCAVVICLPAATARAIAHAHPEPLQVLLAAQLIDAAEQDAADHRRSLLETDPAL